MHLRTQREFDAQTVYHSTLLRTALQAWGPLLQLQYAEIVGKVDRIIRRVHANTCISVCIERWRGLVRQCQRCRAAQVCAVGLKGRRSARALRKNLIAWRFASSWRADRLRPGLKALRTHADAITCAWAFAALQLAPFGGEMGVRLEQRVVQAHALRTWLAACADKHAAAHELWMRQARAAVLRCWRGLLAHRKAVATRLARHLQAWTHIRTLVAASESLRMWSAHVHAEKQRGMALHQLYDFHNFDAHSAARGTSKAFAAWVDAVCTCREDQDDVVQTSALKRAWKVFITRARAQHTRTLRMRAFETQVVSEFLRFAHAWLMARAVDAWTEGADHEAAEQARAERLAEGRAKIVTCRRVLEAFDTWNKRRLQARAREFLKYKILAGKCAAWRAWYAYSVNEVRAPARARMYRAFVGMRSLLVAADERGRRAALWAHATALAHAVKAWKSDVHAARLERDAQERKNRRWPAPLRFLGWCCTRVCDCVSCVGLFGLRDSLALRICKLMYYVHVQAGGPCLSVDFHAFVCGLFTYT
jgi:hypothetical protein